MIVKFFESRSTERVLVFYAPTRRITDHTVRLACIECYLKQTKDLHDNERTVPRFENWTIFEDRSQLSRFWRVLQIVKV